MTQERLNHLLVMQVHKERTDNLDLKAASNEFVSESDHRSVSWLSIKMFLFS